MPNLQVTSDASFGADVEASTGLALVDLAAEWCAPCRLVHPILEDLAGEYAAKVRIFTLDADENPATVSRFGARGLPTVLFFRDGVLVDRLLGALPRQLYLAKIEFYLHGEAAA